MKIMGKVLIKRHVSGTLQRVQGFGIVKVLWLLEVFLFDFFTFLNYYVLII